MATVALDTSVVVAALLGWHEKHDAALASLRKVLENGDDLIVPGHVLVETYAVLTRLPAPHRVAPQAAHEMVRSSFHGRARVVTLGGRDVWALLAESSRQGLAGGLTYDARILQAARKAQADTLITLDVAGYRRLQAEPIRIVVPDDSR